MKAYEVVIDGDSKPELPKELAHLNLNAEYRWLVNNMVCAGTSGRRCQVAKYNELVMKHRQYTCAVIFTCGLACPFTTHFQQNAEKELLEDMGKMLSIDELDSISRCDKVNDRIKDGRAQFTSGRSLKRIDQVESNHVLNRQIASTTVQSRVMNGSEMLEVYWLRLFVGGEIKLSLLGDLGIGDISHLSYKSRADLLAAARAAQAPVVDKQSISFRADTNSTVVVDDEELGSLRRTIYRLYSLCEHEIASIKIR